MHTQIKFNSEAREALQRGLNEVANAVKVSMGAEGRTVVIPTPSRGYIATKDGVSIARAIMPDEEYEKIGASLVKEACSRTNAQAGDGTTTAAVLIQSIYNEGLKLLEKGVSPVILKKGIDKAVEDVVASINKTSVKVSKKNLENVATISVNGDKELGKLIADAFNKIGEHGIVITQVSDTKETTIEVKEGLQLDNGFMDSKFITNPIKGECVLEEPFVLLHKGTIQKGDAVVKLFDSLWSQGKKNTLVVITDDIDPFVLSTIKVNIENGAIANSVCIVKTPQILKIHRDLLGDIANLSGAKIVSAETGNKLAPSSLGRLQKFVATNSESFLIGDVGNLSSTIAELKERIKTETNEFEKLELQERLSRITGGVATLMVGAQTDSELREKQDRIEDGINATRAALEEGILPGGGVALAQIGVSSMMEDQNCAYCVGYNLVMKSIQSPYFQILENAGFKGSVLPDKGHGVNVLNGDVVDMIKAGIIDPAKVTRCAVENAGSVAGTFLTTEAVVALKQ
uniref:Chaperonin GroEL n=1 Tax=uncultured virus TaxID=340016 RepID=A0A240F773_9VIRU|nr:chaperonin GroEL [uncultured virus]